MQEAIRRLVEHMFWADRRVLELLRESDSARSADALRLYAHVLAAERVWLLRLEERDASVQPIWPDWTLVQVEDAAVTARAEYERLLEGLTDEALERTVEYTNSRGTPFRTRIADILLHVAMHGSYHRGQIAAAVRRAGGEPINTDYITYVREID